MTWREQVAAFVGLLVGGLIAYAIAVGLDVTNPWAVLGIGSVLGFLGAHAGIEAVLKWRDE